MKHIRHRVVAAISILTIGITPLIGMRANADSVITEYQATSPGWLASPADIVAGADGGVWFTENESYTNRIGRIATDGTVTEYSVTPPSGQAYVLPLGIAAGSDGALWFTDGPSNNIWRMTVSGVTTRYKLPAPPAGTPYPPTNYPAYIAAGSDGALWFTETNSNLIGRITTAGSITQYSLPTHDVGVEHITSGPDGALWFTENGNNKIGRITTDGSVAEFSIPTSTSFPVGITSGPDGALWFTESNTDKIGRITTDGSVVEYAVPTASAKLNSITSGPDGALWFTESNTDKIGRITTDGSVVEYAVPTASASPTGIVTGPDSNIWFTETGRNAVGRLTLPAPAAPTTLSAPTPTKNNPSLSWNAVSGATSYRVYRDTTMIGVTGSTVYADTGASEGVHEYYVTAVNAAGESAPSNTFEVMLDKTGPQISITTPTVNSSVRSVVTISGTATDHLSGIQSNRIVVHLRAVKSNGKLDGFLNTLYAPVASDGTWSTTFDSTLFADGSYGITVLASDNAGNSQTAVGGASLKPFTIQND